MLVGGDKLSCQLQEPIKNEAKVKLIKKIKIMNFFLSKILLLDKTFFSFYNNGVSERGQKQNCWLREKKRIIFQTIFITIGNNVKNGWKKIKYRNWFQ